MYSIIFTASRTLLKMLPRLRQSEKVARTAPPITPNRSPNLTSDVTEIKESGTPRSDTLVGFISLQKIIELSMSIHDYN